MMQDHLRPDLGMYIELGNEAWHGKFFGGRPKNWEKNLGSQKMSKVYFCPMFTSNIFSVW